MTTKLFINGAQRNVRSTHHFDRIGKIWRWHVHAIQFHLRWRGKREEKQQKLPHRTATAVATVVTRQRSECE